MKKLFSFILCICLLFTVFACGSSKKVEPVAEAKVDETTAEVKSEPIELIVFAAASMTETMNQIKDIYESKNPNIQITYNFDSSGTLLKQIVAGADCDLFISAAQKQMNNLDSTKTGDDNPDGNDFVLQGTRINLLETKVALAVPDGNPKDIKPVEELEKEGKITYGSNVKEVTTQVKEGTVDAGIIYATDAASAKLQVVDLATKDMCRQVIYPAAVLKITKNETEAKKLLDYLKTDEAMNVFESVGFTKAS